MAQKNWLTEFAKKWVEYWTEPARPTEGSLKFIKKRIEEFPKEKPSVLILGSTSEFRDMLYEMGIRPTIVDFNESNYHILSGAMKYKDFYKENEDYIEADWREMDLGKQFDIILADAVFNIVPKESNRELLENIEKHLTECGIFIDRIHQIPEGFEKDFNFEEEVKKHGDDIGKYSLYKVFGTPIYLAAIEELLEPIELKKVAQVAVDLYNKGLISKEKLEEFRKLGKHETDFEFFLPTKKFVDDRISEFFIIDEIFYDYDYPFYPEFYPNYVMNRK